jgi:hypothetical protein
MPVLRAMAEPGTLNFKYVPRFVGVGPPPDSVKSGKLYEFVAEGRDEVGSLSKLNKVLNDHNLKVASAGGYSVSEGGAFIWSGFADYSLSTFKVEDTIREIKRLSFVTQASAVKIGEVVFDQYLFPVTIMGRQRAILVRAAPFVRVEQRLIAAFGSAGKSIMFDEGRNYALESFEQYVKLLPEATPAVLMKNAVAGLRATGWGIFEVDVSRLLIDGFAKIAIREPPFSETPEVKESNFTNGLACGALEAIFHAKTRIESSRYDEASKTLQLFLRTTA